MIIGHNEILQKITLAADNIVSIKHFYDNINTAMMTLLSIIKFLPDYNQLTEILITNLTLSLQLFILDMTTLIVQSNNTAEISYYTCKSQTHFRKSITKRIVSKYVKICRHKNIRWRTRIGFLFNTCWKVTRNNTTKQ